VLDGLRLRFALFFFGMLTPFLAARFRAGFRFVTVVILVTVFRVLFARFFVARFFVARFFVARFFRFLDGFNKSISFIPLCPPS
jgi:hypothetical protein